MIVLTGFYNAEKYVQRSILSIMTQTYKDFTCYITSDRSTDNSINLINNNAAKPTLYFQASAKWVFCYILKM